MKQVFLIFFVVAIGQIGLNAQKTVQGTVEYQYTISGEGAEMMAAMMPEKMIVVYGDNAMMTYMEGGMMAAMMGKIVVNNGEGYVIKEGSKTVYVMSDEDMNSEDQQQAGEVTKIEGETKEVLGYPCQLYQVEVTQDGQKTTQRIWATEGLQAPEMAGGKAASMNQGLMGAFKNIDGFPLEVEVGIPQTGMAMTLSVTKLTLEKPDPAMFVKPEGFTEKPFSEMMKDNGF